MSLLILMRHGKSKWNEKNLFTGWVDVPLSDDGVTEAIEGGKKIADIPIDHIFTSALSRARMTMSLAMIQHSSGKVPVFLHPGEGGHMDDWGKIHSEKAKKETIPVTMAWQLNERMYGALQGSDKDEMRAQYGAEQVQIWRRSYDVPPPEGESLKMTAERTIPYFEENVIPMLAEGKNVFISAHGNSLRSIVMVLENLTPEQVVKLEIPTGNPFTYSYEYGKFTKDLS